MMVPSGRQGPPITQGSFGFPSKSLQTPPSLQLYKYGRKATWAHFGTWEELMHLAIFLIFYSLYFLSLYYRTYMHATHTRSYYQSTTRIFSKYPCQLVTLMILVILVLRHMLKCWVPWSLWPLGCCWTLESFWTICPKLNLFKVEVALTLIDHCNVATDSRKIYLSSSEETFPAGGIVWLGGLVLWLNVGDSLSHLWFVIGYTTLEDVENNHLWE